MPGSAIVTINGQQWTVSLATMPGELQAGLGGVASLPAGTGMLFDLGAELPQVQVTTAAMRFPMDIVFISGAQKVTEVARGIGPGFLVTSSQPARSFLEVNAGEADRVQPGDPVTIQSLPRTGSGVTVQLLPSQPSDLSPVVRQVAEASVLVLGMGVVMGSAVGLVRAFSPPPRSRLRAPSRRERPVLFGPRGERLRQERPAGPEYLPLEIWGSWLYRVPGDEVLTPSEPIPKRTWTLVGMEPGRFHPTRELVERTINQFRHRLEPGAHYVHAVGRGTTFTATLFRYEAGGPVFLQQRDVGTATPGEEPQPETEGPTYRVWTYRPDWPPTGPLRQALEALEKAFADQPFTRERALRYVSASDFEALRRAGLVYQEAGQSARWQRSPLGRAVRRRLERGEDVALVCGPPEAPQYVVLSPHPFDPERAIKWVPAVESPSQGQPIFLDFLDEEVRGCRLARETMAQRRGVMPRLPAEARGDILFMEFVRDLVRMGEVISDEEARELWEDWKRRHPSRPLTAAHQAYGCICFQRVDAEQVPEAALTSTEREHLERARLVARELAGRPVRVVAVEFPQRSVFGAYHDGVISIARPRLASWLQTLGTTTHEVAHLVSDAGERSPAFRRAEEWLAPRAAMYLPWHQEPQGDGWAEALAEAIEPAGDVLNLTRAILAFYTQHGRFPYEGWRLAHRPQEGRSWKVRTRTVEDREVYDVLSPQDQVYWVLAVGDRAWAQALAERLNRAVARGEMLQQGPLVHLVTGQGIRLPEGFTKGEARLAREWADGLARGIASALEVPVSRVRIPPEAPARFVRAFRGAFVAPAQVG